MSLPSLPSLLLGVALVAGGHILAQSSTQVDPNMLLWKKGIEYRTEVSADIGLTNTSIKVNLTDRSAAGFQPRSFFYEGSMAYNTSLLNASGFNGSAARLYQRCGIGKIETNPLTLKVESGVWEIWAQRFGAGLPEEWDKHVEVVERDAEVFGGSTITVTQKPGSPNLLGGGALEGAFQSMGTLSGKSFLLEWNNPKSISKTALKVVPAELRDKRLVRMGGSVSTLVEDVIRRESKLLYEALLGFDSSRKHDDQWVVQGETLDAMVHASVKGKFKGSVVVRAERITDTSPTPKVGPVNGLKLKFISSGIVNGRTQRSNLTFVVDTVVNDEHTTQLNPDGGGFSGEMWLDTENQCLRHGKLEVVDARYDGFLPRIGDLNAKIKLTGDFNFNLIYQQSITATAP